MVRVRDGTRRGRTENPLEGIALTPTETTDVKDTAEVAPATEETHAHEAHDHAGHDHGPSLNPELMREISVEVPADEVSKSFKGVVKRYQKLARIPGFRVGKVPESVIRNRFMKEIRQEVLEGLVSERFRQAIDAQKVSPVSQPQIVDMNLMDGQPLTFKAAFEVLPEFDVSDYASVHVAKANAEVSDEEFASELDRVLEPHATVEPVDEDRALVDGDWAEIGFVGKIQDLAQVVGEEPKDGPPPITGEDVLIEIGGKNTLEAFNGALRGTRPGQELEFEVTYPEDFGERRLAGQTVKYDVTVKAIKRKTYPEKDAEFVKQLGPYEDWADFETKMRERLVERKQQMVEGEARESIVQQLLARYDFPVPESFVQQQVDARLERGLRALAQQGMKSEDMRKLDFGRLRAAQRDEAVKEVKASLILDKIADAEGVQVDQEELDRELLMMSIQGREPLESLKERLEKDGGIERMREQMRREKTGTVLYEKLAS
jgi:trigger factor